MKKKLTTTKKLIDRFFVDWKEFSFNVAFGRIVRDCPFFSWEFRRNYYEKKICAYIKAEYEEIVSRCVKEHNVENSSVTEQQYIWVMWWQGEAAMPPIVKACYSNLKHVASSKEVILITQNNWDQYIEVPEVIVEKVNNKQISLAHFSDIVRVALLKKYGGTWIDATMYVYELPEQIEKKEFYTLKAPGLFQDFISRGEWSTFFLNLQKKDSLFVTCLEAMFFSYWEIHSRVIDYLLFDYFIRLLVEMVPDIRNTINDVDENRNYYDLNLNINNEYTIAGWNKIVNSSPLQKLTYKKDFLMSTENGEDTYYSFLLRKER